MMTTCGVLGVSSRGEEAAFEQLNSHCLEVSGTYVVAKAGGLPSVSGRPSMRNGGKFVEPKGIPFDTATDLTPGKFRTFCCNCSKKFATCCPSRGC